MTENTSPTLAARLLAVMGEVGYIQKEGKTQSGPSFKYVRHDDVVAALRPALVKHGIAFMSGIDETSVGCEQVGTTKSGAARYKTTLVLRLTFVNADNPEEAYSVSFPGEGVDTDDKGSGKALSYALKNGLLKMFLIESGDEADVEQAGAPAVNTAARADEQREQAAAAEVQGRVEALRDAVTHDEPKAPNGGITRTQAEQLHAAIWSKGRTDAAVLTILGENGVGDGKRFGSIPADRFAYVLAQLSKLADPPPLEPTAPAAAPVPAAVSAEDFTQPAPSTQEPAEEVAAPAVTPTTTEPETAPQAAPMAQGGAKDDDGFDVLDEAIKEQAEKTAEPGKAKRKPTVTPQQITRLGALCASIEAKGVGEQEWRTYMETEEGVRSRKLLTKAAATRMIDRFNRWSVDLQTGVVGATEGAAA